MSGTEHRNGEHKARQGRPRRAERERQVQRAIAADRRLPRRPDGEREPMGHEPDARYAYLTQSHD